MTNSSLDKLKQFTFSDDPSPLQANAIYPLTSFCLISAKGVDATKLLQGQVSCDVENLPELSTSIGSHSTPKGRMISSFRLFKINSETYYLLIKSNLAEKALAALKKYALFSKTTLLLEENIIAVGSHGNDAAQLITASVGKLPIEENNLSTLDETTLVNLDENNQAYLVITTLESAANLLSSAQRSCFLTSDKQYTLLNHQKALGFVEEETSELWVAQMLNYQSVGGISFTKGCYTGQEIIARMKYLGKLKRHMYHAIVTSETPLNPGIELHLTKSTQSAGHIVSAIQTDSNQWDVLWILTDDGQAANELFMDKAAVKVKQPIELPYPLDSE